MGANVVVNDPCVKARKLHRIQSFSQPLSYLRRHMLNYLVARQLFVLSQLWSDVNYFKCTLQGPPSR